MDCFIWIPCLSKLSFICPYTLSFCFLSSLFIFSFVSSPPLPRLSTITISFFCNCCSDFWTSSCLSLTAFSAIPALLPVAPGFLFLTPLPSTSLHSLYHHLHLFLLVWILACFKNMTLQVSSPVLDTWLLVIVWLIAHSRTRLPQASVLVYLFFQLYAVTTNLIQHK